MNFIFKSVICGIFFKLGATFGQILLTAFGNGLNVSRFHLVGKYILFKSLGALHEMIIIFFLQATAWGGRCLAILEGL